MTPIDELRQTMAKLRAPDGCPWDREQTLQTLVPYLVEETYEVVDALASGDPGDHEEELGDLLLQIVFQSELRWSEGKFGIDDVARGIVAKLVRRHPHVFGDKQAGNVGEALQSWNEAKDKEQSDKKARRASALDGVPDGLPALGAALRTIDKAAAVRFDWPDAPAALAKLDEELAELRAAVARGRREEVEDELGDVLFAAVAVGRKAGLDPELALRRAVGKFRRRFAVLERVLGDRLGSAELDELLEAWDRAVLAERAGPPTLP